VRYGRGACPEGFLPIFSVNSEDEAQRLLVATCSRGLDGNYYANEMAREQSLAQFVVFGQKLERVYALITSRTSAAGSPGRGPARPRRPRPSGKAVPSARQRRVD
jgi:hypothetical protein